MILRVQKLEKYGFYDREFLVEVDPEMLSQLLDWNE
jgi:hypothetical protein